MSVKTEDAIVPARDKRKDPPSQSELPSPAASNPRVTLSPTAVADELTPFERYEKEALKIAREKSKATGEKYTWWCLTDAVASLSSERYQELLPEGQHHEDLSEEELKGVEKKLTQQEVDSLSSMIVPVKMMQLEDELSSALMCADERNQPGARLIMLDTYSSCYMFPVIHKQIAQANKEVKAAVQRVQGSPTPLPNAAAQALVVGLATISACDSFDHWRLDSESPEEEEKIAKKVLKLAKDLLWFEDSELGFSQDDPYSRKGLIFKLNEIDKAWLGGNSKHLVANNGYGFGRSQAPPPAAKKAKVAHVVSTVRGMTNYLNRISADKLQKRVRTTVQLKIVDMQKPSRSATVVVSGASHMKKISQLVAFLTKKTDEFHYHPRKGKSLKGSRIELTYGDKKTWLAEKSAAKNAAEAGAALSVDGIIKIVQVFQGLTTGHNSGIVYDSNEAKAVASTKGAVVWVAPDQSRYEIMAQAILPNKCTYASGQPMPRVVSHDPEPTMRAKTGFGRSIVKTNKQLQGNRKGPSVIIFPGEELNPTVMAAECAMAPLCNSDGTGCGKLQSQWNRSDIEMSGLPGPN